MSALCAVFARVGSRYDGGFTPGISHVLEKLAFQVHVAACSFLHLFNFDVCLFFVLRVHETDFCKTLPYTCFVTL